MRKHILLGHGKNIPKHNIHRALYNSGRSHAAAMLGHKTLQPPVHSRVGTGVGKKIKPLSFRF